MTISGRELEGVARSKVIGVGGGGSNAVSRMFRERISGVQYIVMNTDIQALMKSDVPNRVRIGEQLTQGMGVGGDPDKGSASAEESREEIYDVIRDSNMVFIAAGMGGGTGTGAAPVIAEIAQETGALTVGVVTRPFAFEGIRRSNQAQIGIERLQTNVDTLLVIPNQRLSIVSREEVSAENAFRLADVSIEGATGVLFNITGGSDLKLSELHEAAEVIQRVVDPEANIIFGMTTDHKMENEIKITIIATGFPTTDTLLQRDIARTVEAVNRVEINEDSLHLPPILSRGGGKVSHG